MFIVQLEPTVEKEPAVWIAAWEGDPGRTLVKRMAQRFPTQCKAQKALDKARTYSPFIYAKIQPGD